MNAGTDLSSSEVQIATEKHVRITFISDNNKWEGQWDFYPDCCDFTMTIISPSHKCRVQYEGVPGGEMDTTDFCYASIDKKRHPIEESLKDDLPAPEWMASGNQNAPRIVHMLPHENNEIPDNYGHRPDMTVLGFGRENGEKTANHLTAVQSFSSGFVE